MANSHLVQVGLLGQIGRFFSVDGRFHRRDDQVVCRTDRGLEVGRVLCSLEHPVGSDQADGQLMRRMTPEDRLIFSRIERFRDKAFDACQKLLWEAKLDAVLVDVEHLFDGQSLYFYFLGNVPDEVHVLTDALAEAYDKKVRFRKFVQTLANGCGPDCGTDLSKCSTGGCASCAVRDSCTVREG